MNISVQLMSTSYEDIYFKSVRTKMKFQVLYVHKTYAYKPILVLF